MVLGKLKELLVIKEELLIYAREFDCGLASVGLRLRVRRWVTRRLASKDF